MKKIAVVEDNPDNQLLIQAILEDRYDIQFYNSGMEALKGIKKNPPDLILLDISLPEMDGTEVLNQLHADHDLRSIPVVALTAHAMAGDREKYLSCGFDDYITKPILSNRILISVIENWVQKGSELARPSNDS
ncbi:MAG: response regulator [Acidobacteria bacterium]|nr:response regulator [Acidobacteriota bacterium]